MLNLDQLLDTISIVVWLFFIVYAIAVVVRTLLRHGPLMAVLQLVSAKILIPFLIAVLVSFISAALVFVQPTHVGVVVSMVSPDGVRPQPMRAGLHIIVPILEKDVKYPIYWQTYTMSNKIHEGAKEGDDSIRARTSDGQEVRLGSSVVFRLDAEQAVTIHVDWQERYIDDYIRPIIRGLVRTQVSQFTVREVNSSARRDLETLLDRLLREQFSEKGIIMDSFLLRDIAFTDEYAESIELKQVAQEGMERAAHEAEQIRNLAAGERDRIELEAEGRKEQFILEAEGRAQAIRLEAEAQAEALTLLAGALSQNRDLLTYEYINKLSPNIRAMLVPNNAPLILPLDELVDGMNPSGTITTTMTAPLTTPVTTAVSSPTAADGVIPVTPTPGPSLPMNQGGSP